MLYWTGIILVLIGFPFALCNWYSPVSIAISGKYCSMVPPVGGLLIGIGLLLATGSIFYALAGLLADFGMLWLLATLILPKRWVFKSRGDGSDD